MGEPEHAAVSNSMSDAYRCPVLPRTHSHRMTCMGCAGGHGRAAWFDRRYIASEYGSLQEAKLEILCDFFKHGFDGDGDDGGSCIDGRLTSAWNWCSKIEKKKYFNLFLLTGFIGFDGKF